MGRCSVQAEAGQEQFQINSGEVSEAQHCGASKKGTQHMSAPKTQACIGLDTSALDPQFKGHAQRGIGRYVFELNRYLTAHPTSQIAVKSFDQATLRSPSLASRCIDLLPAGRRTLSQQMLYPLRLNRGPFAEFDVVHFPAHMDAPAWSPKKYILTVLDLIPLVLEDLYKADKPSWRFHFARFLEKRAIQNASLILAISHHTARDVAKYLAVPPERIVVTHLGIDDSFYAARVTESEGVVRARYAIPPQRPIVLYVGGIDQRKNVKGLLTGFSKASRRAREARQVLPLLVMAGGIQKDAHYPGLLQLAKELEIEDSVCLPGYVPEADLMQLYALSSVFFFPSLYEGFGFPPLEAMAAGIPVLSSQTSCMPEVLGDAAVLYDPLDDERAGLELYQLLYTPEHASRFRALGPKQARQFTWSNTGEQTLRAYERLLGERS
jgi:glycosyltransferase involved in cell wall biosynthesis